MELAAGPRWEAAKGLLPNLIPSLPSSMAFQTQGCVKISLHYIGENNVLATIGGFQQFLKLDSKNK